MILSLKTSLHICLEHVMERYVQYAQCKLNHNKTTQAEAVFTVLWLTVLFYCLVFCKPPRCRFGILQHSRENYDELHNVSGN